MANIDLYYVSDGRDHNGALFVDYHLTRAAEWVAGVRDLVDKLVKKLENGPDRIRELRVVGHGNQTGMWIGQDFLDAPTVHLHATQLHRLRNLFARPEGLITLGGCKVGQSPVLLIQLSDFTDVPVRAFTELQRGTPGDEGYEVLCYQGKCTWKVAAGWKNSLIGPDGSSLPGLPGPISTHPKRP